MLFHFIIKISKEILEFLLFTNVISSQGSVKILIFPFTREDIDIFMLTIISENNQPCVLAIGGLHSRHDGARTRHVVVPIHQHGRHDVTCNQHIL